MTDACGHIHVVRGPAHCASVIVQGSKGGNASLEQDGIVPLGNGGWLRPPPFFIALTTPKKYPAVTIATGMNCCAAVRALEGKRILAGQAPALPMPKCTMPAECRCRFKKHVDRRDDEQGRRFLYGQESSAWYAGGQRRKSRGRRDKD